MRCAGKGCRFRSRAEEENGCNYATANWPATKLGTIYKKYGVKTLAAAEKACRGVCPLYEAGEREKGSHAIVISRRPSIDAGKARALYEAGKYDREIAAELGCTICTVANWRKRNALPGHGLTTRKTDPERALQLFKEGKTFREIGEAMGTTANTAREWLKRRGLIETERPKVDAEKIREMYNSGASDEEIAEALGVRKSTVETHRQKMGLLRTGKDYGKQAEQLYKEGMTDREIAVRCDMSTASIQRWRKRMGYPPNKKPRERRKGGSEK